MIEPLENLPDGVIGFRAVGTIEPDDYKDVLDPAIDAATQGGEKVRLVYVIGDDFDRYTVGALWQDSKLGAGHNIRSWERVAFVTNHDWLGHAAALFAPVIPGEIKVFPLEEQDAAVAWAGGS